MNQMGDNENTQLLNRAYRPSEVFFFFRMWLNQFEIHFAAFDGNEHLPFKPASSSFITFL
jgi:hypothetical protein